MPIDVGQFSTEVTAVDGDVPLSPTQVEKLVELVVRRLEQRQRDQQSSREATTIRRQAAAPRHGA